MALLGIDTSLTCRLRIAADANNISVMKYCKYLQRIGLHGFVVFGWCRIIVINPALVSR